MDELALFVDGRCVATPDRDDVIDPALGERFASSPRATAAHVEEAVAAAARAFPAWSADQAARRQKLEACAAALRGAAQSLGELVSREQGKPIGAAVAEVKGAAAWFSYFAALPTPAEVVQDDAAKRMFIVRKPLGVVAAITPWNFPVILLAWKLAPALLAGNTVVAKPSPFTPLSALRAGRILGELLPPGVLNVVAGGNELGAVLTQQPAVRKISFTGSIETGKRIMASAAADLKRLTLELGGNDAAIVLPDVDPAAVASKLFWGAFFNSGQVCVGIKRLFVHDQVFEPLVEALARVARGAKLGRGLDPATELGPLNNLPQLERVSGMVEEARKAGATVVTGGARLDGPGYFYPPTIVTGVSRGMRLVDDEQFGTALPVLRYSDLDAAIEEANATRFGLGASVWTNDLERGTAIVQRLEAGTGWVNHHQDITPVAPFGGTKWSGLGVEGGLWGYHEFSSMQLVNVKKPPAPKPAA